MAAVNTELVLRQVRRLLTARRVEPLPDLELLQRFTASHDEDAFAALVERHGPMVLGVCRRVLGHEQDAEDAFQATFLVLARRAACIRRREALGPYLYRVAQRVALRARAVAFARSARERCTAPRAPAEPAADLTWRELQEVLDEELCRLPEQYRAPLVLCCLEGKARDEAAQELGWSLGALKGRLERGRALLRDRLARRGVVLSAVLLATALAEGASPGRAPAALVSATARTTARFAVDPRAIASRVAALAETAAPALAATRLRAALLAGLAGIVLATGAALVARAPQAPEQPPTAGAPVEPARPRTDRHGDALPAGALARLGTVRLRHGNFIYALALSPDGKVVVSVGGHPVIHFWDAATGKGLRDLPVPGPGGGCESAAFSPDGKLLATGAFDSVWLWDGVADKPVRRLDQPGSPVVAFAPDGKTLAAGDRYGGLCLWDPASGQRLARLQKTREGNAISADDAIRALAFSPDGRLLASPRQSLIVLWDVASRKPVGELRRHRRPVTALAFSPDGKLVASGSEDKTVRLWDVAGGTLLRQLKGHQARVRAVAFSPDGRTLATGSGVPTMSTDREEHALRLWEVATGKELAQVGSHADGVCSLAFTPDGRTLVSGGGGSVRLWDAATWQERAGSGGHQDWVSPVAFAPDGRLLATAGGDHTVRLWDPATAREVRRLAGCEAAVDSVVFSPDGRRVAAGSRDGILRLWDTDGREWGFIEAHDREAVVAFSPDGNWLASGSRDGAILLWDPARRRKVREMETHADEECVCLAFSPDGRVLASGSLGSQTALVRGTSGTPPVRLWDVATGKEVRVLEGHEHWVHSVAFSPDGKLLASGSWDKTVRLWDVASGKAVGVLRGHRIGVRGVAFSPDGKSLASAGFDGTVRLWEVATGKERCRFEGHAGAAHEVAFAPDGRTLASSSMDTTVLIWDVRGPGAERQAVGHTPSAGELESAWTALAGEDAERAYGAIVRLSDAAGQAVPFLGSRLRPAVIDPRHVAGLVRDLDSDHFETRQKASAELEALGEAAVPTLRSGLEGRPSAEARRHIEGLLDKVPGPVNAPEVLRALRAIEVLERARTPEARRLLERLAQGSAEARLTREAKASLRRLDSR